MPFYYRGNAVAIDGNFSRIHGVSRPNTFLLPQAPSMVPITGGRAHARVSNFKFEDFLSFDDARTEAGGSFDEIHNTYNSYAFAAIEKLNVLNMITADRVVSRMMCSFPVIENNVAEPSFSIIGSYFENFRILGHRVDVKLSTDLSQKYATFSAIERDHAQGKVRRVLPWGFRWSAAESAGLPEGVTVEGPRDQTTLGAVIKIPEFGVIHLAEVLIQPTSRQLVMLRLELGSPTEGRTAGCSLDVGGFPDPVAEKAPPRKVAVGGKPDFTASLLTTPPGGEVKIQGRKGKKVGPPPPEKRYTNVSITSGKDHSLVPRSHGLESGRTYDLRLNIGEYSPDSAVENAEQNPFPDDLLPDVRAGYWLQVVVASEDFLVKRNRYYLFLPRTGSSWVCSCRFGSEHVCKSSQRSPFLVIPFVPRQGKGDKPAFMGTMRIAIYYEMNLVESLLLTAEIQRQSRSGYGYRLKIDYTLAPGFRSLNKLPARTLNILANKNEDGTHRIVINGAQDQAVTFRLSEGQMGNAVNKVRDALRAMHVKGDPPRLKNLYDKNNAKPKGDFITDVENLALIGWRLFTTLAGDKPQTRKRLLDELRSHSSIQVSRIGGSNFIFPWACVYDIALELSKPHQACRLLQEWDKSSAVLEDSTTECPFEKEHAYNTLCPFGFWGFRHSIELPPSSPERVLPLQIAVANKPPQIVVGLSRDLDEKLTAAHLQTLQAVKAYVDRRDSLEEILKALNQERLEVVYFYCHGGSDDRDGPYLEVGKGEPIWPPDVTAWGTTWNETHWKETSPLIFINGCRTAALTPDVLVNFVDNFVGVYAAGVIGTEVIVHQQLANEVALEVLTRMLLRNSVGRSISEMRMHLLRKGNLLGLAYTPYCSASLALSAPASA